MIQFDKTQPIRHRAPRLDFGRGVYMAHVIGDQYAIVTQSGTHLDFIEAEHVEYQNDLSAEFKARSVKR